MPASVLNTNTGTYTIPATHTHRLVAIQSGKQSAPVPIDQIIQQILSPDFKRVYEVPATRILKLANCVKSTRLVLCPSFDLRTGTCADGDGCIRVHADVSDTNTFTPHVNYAWTSLDVVDYDRHDGSDVHEVAAPGSRTIVDVVPSRYMLKTMALESDRRPLAHCAHYYYDRACNQGPDCQFVHGIFIDPNAKLLQIAPTPVKLGRCSKATLKADPSAKPSSKASRPSCLPPVLIVVDPHVQRSGSPSCLTPLMPDSPFLPRGIYSSTGSCGSDDDSRVSAWGPSCTTSRATFDPLVEAMLRGGRSVVASLPTRASQMQTRDESFNGSGCNPTTFNE